MARYGYSDLIVSNGSLTLPEGANEDKQNRLRNACGEKPPPLCLVLNGSAEVFLAKPDLMKTFPLQLIGPGEMFGVFEALDKLYSDVATPGFYSVSSGCVSIRIIGTRLKDKHLPKKVGQELNRPSVSWDHHVEPPCHFVRRLPRIKTRGAAKFSFFPPPGLRAQSRTRFSRSCYFA